MGGATRDGKRKEGSEKEWEGRGVKRKNTGEGRRNQGKERIEKQTELVLYKHSSHHLLLLTL